MNVADPPEYPAQSSNTTNETMANDNTKGFYLHAVKDLQLEERALAQPEAHEIQIAPRSTTLCGSDIHYYQHFRNGDIQVREPLCLGHESSGVVLALGSEASKTNPDVKVGDAVAIECGVPCEQCTLCKNGRYNVCPNLRFRSSASKFPHYQGSLQERVNHPAKWVHKLPSAISYDTGALLEPLAVSIHAVRRSGKVLEGSRDTCLIFGAGAIGLLCSLVCQAEGCKDIIMVDIDNDRLQFALENGFAQAIYAVAPRRGATLEEKKTIARETAQSIGEMNWKDGQQVGRVQRTFECTGVESCLQASIYVRIKSRRTILLANNSIGYAVRRLRCSRRHGNTRPHPSNI